MKIKTETVHYSLIFILGLVPLLWFEPGHLIKQLDFDLPLTLARFKATFFSMWDYQNGAGLPRNLHMPAFMFFLPQVFLGFLGLSLEVIQRIFFCIWFMLPGYAFYYLMKVLLPNRDGGSLAGRIIAVSFYMFNLYLDPIWIGFNMANLSAYVAVPIALGVLMKGFAEKSSVFLVAFKVSLVFTLFPAMATNPSMTLIAAAPLCVLILKYLIDEKFKLSSLSYLVKLFLLTITMLTLFNLYWILPEVKKLFETNMVLTSSGVVGGSLSDDVFFVDDWVKGISQHTSLVNVIKMQGDWPWYQGYRPYAELYWNHWLLIGMAWFPFTLSLFALWKAKHQYKWFFGGFLFVSLILSTGTHPPFGVFFSFLMENVPLFWTIRSPWYKFTFLTCLGYGVLIGLGSQIIFQAITKIRFNFKKMVYALLLFCFIAVSPSYSFPLVQGKMFRRPAPDQGYPNHFKIPVHVKDAAKWLNQRAKGARVLDLPSRGISYNEWGYEGFLPLIGYFLKVPLYCDNHPLHIPYQGAFGSSWMYLQKLVRNSFEKGLTPYVSNLLRLLRVKYILHEEDFKYPVLPFPTSVKEINSKIGVMKGVEKVKTFSDQWSVWEVGEPIPEVYSLPQISLVNGGVDTFVPLSVRIKENPGLVLLADIDSKTYQELTRRNYVKEVITFEDSLVDWVVHSFNPKYLQRITVKSTEEWMVSKKKFFEIQESGEHLIFARKRVPNREIALRIRVDFTPYLQAADVQWNLKVFQKSIMNIKKEDIVPDEFHLLLLKSSALLFGLQYQNLSFLFVKKVANVLLDKEKQGVWNRALFYIDGENNFKKEDSVLAFEKEYPSKNWQYLGNRVLKEGKHSILAKAVLNRRSIWDFYIVPKKHYEEQKRLAFQLFSNEQIGQTQMFSSTSSWGSMSELEKKDYHMEKDPNIDFKEDVHNRTFGYSFFDKDFVCSVSDRFKIFVNNKSDKPVKSTLAFNLICLQKMPKTFDVLLNGEKIKQVLVDPMQDCNVIVKSVELQPGKNHFYLAFYTDAVPLGEVLGNEESRKARFAIRNIQMGKLNYQEKFVLPSERTFQVKLFPFLESDQSREAWAKAKHVDEILIDNQRYPLERVLDEQRGLYLQVKESIRLKKGTHSFLFSKEVDPEYFVLFESPSNSFVPEAQIYPERKTPNKVKLEIESAEPQVLIFSESFDSKWVAQTDKGKELPHFNINGYANAYLLPETGKNKISIVYTPQEHFRKGLMASVSSLLILSLVALYIRRRKYK